MMFPTFLFTWARVACLGHFLIGSLSAMSLSGLSALKLPPLADICPQCDLAKILQSSECNVSRVPVDPKFTIEAISGNWYELMGTRNELSAVSSLFTITDRRSTFVEGEFGDTVRVFTCGRQVFLGGLAQDICPNGEFELQITENNVLKSAIPEILRPLNGLVPQIDFDQIQKRVISVDDELMVTYSCLVPLADGTCTKTGLFLAVLSRTKQLSPSALERVKTIVASTCINFDDLETHALTGDFPFYEPA